MQVHSGKACGSSRLARTGVELSREARVRLAWMDFYRDRHNVAHTCRHFGISRQTFYRWQRRYDAFDLRTLESRSHRPHRQRQPTWTFPLEEKVLTLGLQFPRWGKDKLAVLLRRLRQPVSTSMVGRILTQLKRQGRLVEPSRSGVPGSRRALRPRPYAVRKPKQYAVSRPGDLVEVDTLDVRPLPGVIFKQFTARDVISRWDVIQAHTRATAQTAAQFLDTLQHRMPFPIRAVQVDGGSEFAAEFELACQQRRLHLFVLPPRSPKLNGGAVPTAPLIFDKGGNLYGTTQEGGNRFGTVFELSPNSDGSWTESVLLLFGGMIGAYPQPAVVFDQMGNLYGTTTGDGGDRNGTVFELSPNGNGTWTPTVLHSFSNRPGSLALGGLIVDKHRKLYGTTAGNDRKTFGSAFQIIP